jgi:ubiquinone/menaquinone biosynthesis C-methylase UbiE
MATTNVKPWELNYDRYAASKYDRDIVNSIPYHREIHQLIGQYLTKQFERTAPLSVLDLGTGTGITAKLVKDVLPNAQLTVVDFSKQILDGAKKRLGKTNVRYIMDDYATAKFDKKYDIVISVIGIHHQSTTGKKKVFKKTHSLLKRGGVFIFGDLVTYRNEFEAAQNSALHYHHLVEHATDQKTLAEWAHHHMFLNDLAPLEDQEAWLRKSGFAVKRLFLKFNTALVVCRR